MKKISILIIAAAIIGGAGYYGWQWNAKQNNIVPGPETPHNFEATGNLVRNNPGMKENTWFLVYERPGAPAMNIELSFSDSSKCFVGASSTACSEIGVPNGSRANVEGNILKTVVDVSSLSAESVDDTIRVTSPKKNEEISGPIKISGEARGSWFFEASFPAKLLVGGTVVTTSVVQAKSDWMTTNFVPFEAVMNFDVATRTPAELVLSADNPSGIAGNDKSVTVPIVLMPKVETRGVVLYFYNEARDLDTNGNIKCSSQGLQKVQRTIPKTASPLQDVIKLLLKGEMTPEEKAAGMKTEFPLPGVDLTKAVIENGVARLEFTDPNFRTSGGSCRVSVLWAEIEATAKQFSNIKEVKYSPPELFQP